MTSNKDKSNKRKTSVRKNNCNPVFKEALRVNYKQINSNYFLPRTYSNMDFSLLIKYTVSHSEIYNYQLSVSVWHNDTFGKNKFLGEVLIKIDEELLDNPRDIWYELTNNVIRI